MAIAQKDLSETSAKPVANDAAKNDVEPAIPTIEGRVDAIDRQRLFGWVWCPERPDARIEVIVRLKTSVSTCAVMA